MFKKAFILFLVLLAVIPSSAQKKTYFAVGIIAGANSSILTYAIVTKINDKYSGTRTLSEQYFMYYAMGHWPCIANPTRENLFKKYEVSNCYLLYDDYGKVNGYYIGAFEEIWKIKYQSHPHRRDLPSGWSKGYHNPTPGQAKFLYENYGVLHVNTHFFVGDFLFQLLKDIQDPEWIEIYQNL